MEIVSRPLVDGGRMKRHREAQAKRLDTGETTVVHKLYFQGIQSGLPSYGVIRDLVREYREQYGMLPTTLHCSSYTGRYWGGYIDGEYVGLDVNRIGGGGVWVS